MGKFRVLSGKQECAILARHGFVEVRRRGSHMVMQEKLSQGTITVPVPDHDKIRIGTLQVCPGVTLNHDLLVHSYAQRGTQR